MAVDKFEIGGVYEFRYDQEDEDVDIIEIKKAVYEDGMFHYYGLWNGQEDDGCLLVDDDWHKRHCILLTKDTPSYEPEDWS